MDRKNNTLMWCFVSYLIFSMFHVLIAGGVVGAQRADGEPWVVLQEDVEWDDTVLVSPALKAVRGVGGKELKNAKSSEQTFNCNLRNVGVFKGQDRYFPQPRHVPSSKLNLILQPEVVHFQALKEHRYMTKKFLVCTV